MKAEAREYPIKTQFRNFDGEICEWREGSEHRSEHEFGDLLRLYDLRTEQFWWFGTNQLTPEPKPVSMADNALD